MSSDHQSFASVLPVVKLSVPSERFTFFPEDNQSPTSQCPNQGGRSCVSLFGPFQFRFPLIVTKGQKSSLGCSYTESHV